MCASFKAVTGNGHQLKNSNQNDVIYLEMGDRTPGGQAVFPDDAFQADLVNGKWQFTRKDGRSYDS